MRVVIDPAKAAEYPHGIQSNLKQRSAAAEWLGQRIVEFDVEAEWIKIAYEFTEAQGNLFGAIHGGCVAAVMDDAMGYATGLKLPAGHISPTLEMKVSYLHMARPGRHYVEARVVRRGKQIVFIEASLSSEAGRLLARGSATQMMTPLKV